MAAAMPKPFLQLGGRPILLRTLSRFTPSQVRRVIVVVARQQVAECQGLIRSDSWLDGLEVLLQAGGPTRRDSVQRGLARLDPDCEVVLIHDGVRPFVSPGLIDRCAEAAFKEGAVVVGLPVRDTVKVVSSDGEVKETPPRDSLWGVQTPQAFQTEVIREAFRTVSRETAGVTDDAMLVERLGRRVAVLEGEWTNIKITTPEDLLVAEAWLRAGLVS